MCVKTNILFYIYIFIYEYIYIYIYISAEVFQRESVLDYIFINRYLPILQTPSSHYCNTLQSPIQQIAIYLYCRMHLKVS